MKKKDTIVLNNDTKILYNYQQTKKLEETIFTINNKNKQTIISFCKTDLEYNISVNFKESKNNLLICNDSFDSMCPIHKYLNLELSDGTEKEILEDNILDEETVLEEIFFIIYHDKQFEEKNVLRSFNIITPLLKDLIKDFIEFKSKNILWNNKKLVKKN